MPFEFGVLGRYPENAGRDLAVNEVPSCGDCTL